MKAVKIILMVAAAVVAVAVLGALALAGLGAAGILPGFGGVSMVKELVNRQVFSAAEIEALQVAYGSDRITLLPSQDGQVVLEEYMSRRDDAMLARVAQNGSTLSISAGERPVLQWFLWFGYNIEIRLYIPAEWMADVRIESGSGGIHAGGDFALRSLTAKTGSGSVRLAGVRAAGGITLGANSGDITAEDLAAGGDIALSCGSGSVNCGQVRGAAITASANSGGVRMDLAAASTVEARASSGSVKIGRIEGAFELRANSGGIQVGGGTGHGTASVGSGTLRIALQQLSGNLEMRANSGSCRLALPPGTAFSLRASTGSGGIHVPDSTTLSYDKHGNITGGGYGQSPQHTVDMQTGIGSLHLDFEG